jgi:hypothetical protein
MIQLVQLLQTAQPSVRRPWRIVMRVSLFVSAMFAASLLGGVAMADRPSEDGGRSSHFNVREARSHEAREARTHEGREAQTQTRDSKITERFRTHGDMVDRYASHGPAASSQKVANTDAAAKSKNPLNAKQEAVRNCSPNDDTCGSSSRANQASAKSSSRADKAITDSQGSMQRQEIQKMVNKIRNEKLEKVLAAKMAEAVAGKLGLAAEAPEKN